MSLRSLRRAALRKGEHGLFAVRFDTARTPEQHVKAAAARNPKVKKLVKRFGLQTAADLLKKERLRREGEHARMQPEGVR